VNYVFIPLCAAISLIKSIIVASTLGPPIVIAVEMAFTRGLTGTLSSWKISIKVYTTF